jgi:WD40 repeat protein
VSDTIYDDTLIPELVVSTEHGKVLLISRPASDESRPQTSRSLFSNVSAKSDMKQEALLGDIPSTSHLISSLPGGINAVIAHPQMNYFAVGGDAGIVQVWDYVTRRCFLSRSFESTSPDDPKLKLKAEITCMAYSSSGKTLGIGFSNGYIKMLDSSNLSDLPQTVYDGTEPGHCISDSPIVKIEFSPEAEYCAVADAKHVIGILYKDSTKVKTDEPEESPFQTQKKQEPEKTRTARQRIEWSILGRAKSHFKSVVSLLYPTTEPDEPIRLFSVSMDRHVAEYDLSSSTVETGVVVLVHLLTSRFERLNKSTARSVRSCTISSTQFIQKSLLSRATVG